MLSASSNIPDLYSFSRLNTRVVIVMLPKLVCLARACIVCQNPNRVKYRSATVPCTLQYPLMWRCYNVHGSLDERGIIIVDYLISQQYLLPTVHT